MFSLHRVVLTLLLTISAKPCLAVDSLSPNLNLEEALELEVIILQSFNQFQCEKMGDLAPANQYPRLTAVALAVAAYCSPSSTADRLFRDATARDPNNKTIQELVAAYKKINLGGPRPLIKIENSWDGFATSALQLGIDSNPANRTGDDATLPSSTLGKASMTAGVLKREAAISYGVNTHVAQSIFPGDPVADLFESTAEFPFLIQAGRRELIKSRAYASYLHLSKPFYLIGGVSVAAILYHHQWRHVAQTAIYWDNFFQKRYRSQSGTHFRFDYTWEYFPVTWFAKALFVLEHTQAGRETAFFANSNIPYSHNDVFISGTIEAPWRSFVLNLYTKFLLRYDDNNSVYNTGGPSGPTVRKQRTDFTITLQSSISYPVGRGFYLFGYYRWDRNFSNIGKSDYDNKNYEAHELGTGLRVSWGEM